MIISLDVSVNIGLHDMYVVYHIIYKENTEKNNLFLKVN